LVSLADRRTALDSVGDHDLPGDREPDRAAPADRGARSHGSRRGRGMSTNPRVALFSDSHYEANGVARTTNALENYPRRRRVPLLSVHAGPTTRVSQDGSVVRLELARRAATSFRLEHDLSFDLALWRHTRRTARELARFRPDVVHITGPSDIGQLGVWLAYRQ